jgi:hypothetical protein
MVDSEEAEDLSPKVLVLAAEGGWGGSEGTNAAKILIGRYVFMHPCDDEAPNTSAGDGPARNCQPTGFKRLVLDGWWPGIGQ